MSSILPVAVTCIHASVSQFSPLQNIILCTGRKFDSDSNNFILMKSPNLFISYPLYMSRNIEGMGMSKRRRR